MILLLSLQQEKILVQQPIQHQTLILYSLSWCNKCNHLHTEIQQLQQEFQSIKLHKIDCEIQDSKCYDIEIPMLKYFFNNVTYDISLKESAQMTNLIQKIKEIHKPTFTQNCNEYNNYFTLTTQSTNISDDDIHIFNLFKQHHCFEHHVDETIQNPQLCSVRNGRSFNYSESWTEKLKIQKFIQTNNFDIIQKIDDINLFNTIINRFSIVISISSAIKNNIYENKKFLQYVVDKIKHASQFNNMSTQFIIHYNQEYHQIINQQSQELINIYINGQHGYTRQYNNNESLDDFIELMFHDINISNIDIIDCKQLVYEIYSDFQLPIQKIIIAACIVFTTISILTFLKQEEVLSHLRIYIAEKQLKIKQDKKNGMSKIDYVKQHVNRFNLPSSSFEKPHSVDEDEVREIVEDSTSTQEQIQDIVEENITQKETEQKATEDQNESESAKEVNNQCEIIVSKLQEETEPVNNQISMHNDQKIVTEQEINTKLAEQLDESKIPFISKCSSSSNTDVAPQEFKFVQIEVANDEYKKLAEESEIPIFSQEYNQSISNEEVDMLVNPVSYIQPNNTNRTIPETQNASQNMASTIDEQTMESLKSPADTRNHHGLVVDQIVEDCTLKNGETGEPFEVHKSSSSEQVSNKKDAIEDKPKPDVYEDVKTEKVSINFDDDQKSDEKIPLALYNTYDQDTINDSQ